MASSRFLSSHTYPIHEPGANMNNTRQLHELGQSLWLDGISREMLDGGTLRRYIDEFSVTGLTSNPSIFDKASTCPMIVTTGGRGTACSSPADCAASSSNSSPTFSVETSTLVPYSSAINEAASRLMG